MISRNRRRASGYRPDSKDRIPSTSSDHPFSSIGSGRVVGRMHPDKKTVKNKPIINARESVTLPSQLDEAFMLKELSPLFDHLGERGGAEEGSAPCEGIRQVTLQEENILYILRLKNVPGPF